MSSAGRTMTDAERTLLMWCAIFLLRQRPPTPEEAEEIESLIAEVRRDNLAWATTPAG
jgi:hypothetical protein